MSLLCVFLVVPGKAGLQDLLIDGRPTDPGQGSGSFVTVYVSRFNLTIFWKGGKIAGRFLVMNFLFFRRGFMYQFLFPSSQDYEM